MPNDQPLSGTLSLSTTRRLEARAISAAAYPLLAVLGRTLRWNVDGRDHLDAVVQSGRQPIFAFWHGRILAGLQFFQHRGIVVITSQNFDGEWIAGIITRFGFGTARGSTSRGGARALAQLRRDLAANRPVAFTVDGPRGPARVAQPGAVWLAGATGHPLLPFHSEATRFWTASSWDRTQIPKPFSTLSMVIGPPLDIPGTDAPTVEAGRQRLAASLGVLEARAHELLH